MGVSLHQKHASFSYIWCSAYKDSAQWERQAIRLIILELYRREPIYLEQSKETPWKKTLSNTGQLGKEQLEKADSSMILVKQQTSQKFNRENQEKKQPRRALLESTLENENVMQMH